MSECTPLINPIASTSREEAQHATERTCLWFILLGATNWFIVVCVENILPLYAHLEWNTPESYTGILLFVVTLLSGTGIPVWIHASYKFGFGRVLTYTFLPSIVCSLLMAFSDSFIMLAIFFSINGCFSVSDEVTSTLISVVMPRVHAEEWVSINLGLEQIFIMAGFLVAGALYEYVSPRGVFWATAIVSVLSFVGGYFKLVGQQAVIESKQIEAYEAHARENGHSDPDHYAVGITHERDEFPIVLHKYDAYAETFDFWNLSRFESIIFSLLTFMYAYFMASMLLLFIWWPLFCHQKWHVGPVLANSQLIFNVVISTIATIVSPLFIDWTVNFIYGHDSLHRESDDDGGEEETTVLMSSPPSAILQNDRDRITLIHFAISNIVSAPCWWVMVVSPITFKQNWLLMAIFGVVIGLGMTALVILLLRFQRAGDSSQIFGIQGFFWQWTLAILNLSVGFLWGADGYKSIVYIPLLGNVVCLLGAAVLFILYGMESSWNKANLE